MITKEQVLEQVAYHDQITAAKIAVILDAGKKQVKILLRELLDEGMVIHNHAAWQDARKIATKDPSPFPRPKTKTRNVGFFW